MMKNGENFKGAQIAQHTSCSEEIVYKRCHIDM